MSTPSNVAYQVMWNRMISIVEEQAQALVRTAFSTSVREAGDLSAGVYDTAGQMLAQAVTGTPGHVNAMADAVGHFALVAIVHHALLLLLLRTLIAHLCLQSHWLSQPCQHAKLLQFCWEVETILRLKANTASCWKA